MVNFLGGQHPDCNDVVCTKLGMEHPNSDVIKDLKAKSIGDSDRVLVICELCYCHLETDFANYLEKTKNKLVFCQQCSDRRRESITQKLCGTVVEPKNDTEKQHAWEEGCKQPFSYSTYFYKMMGFTVPVFCRRCIELYKKNQTRQRIVVDKKIRCALQEIYKAKAAIKGLMQEKKALLDRYCVNGVISKQNHKDPQLGSVRAKIGSLYAQITETNA